MIERFGHGGDLETAQAAFGVERSEWVDFSANINPMGPPAHVLARIQQEWSEIVHYPDPDHRRFRKLLAVSLGIDEAMLCIGNGAAECMALALLAAAPKRVGVVYPCFSEYIELSKKFGAEVVGIYGEAANDFRASLPELQELMKQVDFLFLGQPNNPTGVQYGVQELEQLAVCAADEQTLLVIDEAFIDFIAPEAQATLLPRLAQFSHVILIRSMTKFYAIPGLRLGFAMARPELIQQLKSKQVTWSVNRLALAAGEACMTDCEAYEVETRRQTETERRFLVEALEQEFGCQTWPSLANFILVRLPQPWTAAALQAKLGERGVLIRSCAMYEGLTDADIRIAVKDRVRNEILLSKLTEVWEEGGPTI
ncbi:threonine-phosphate decarboxylase [Paenibacillus selenitireducens]|uniref:threonine-phosphate decarboxylase n=1 Tax=Paenibacillus selenitireducens TaxID=1324314 RepID=A0A1T2XB21_9BACL|nr:threonine-phosphate decarboxylase CobD [Paenibacillus selenitireducens]OPA77002.1 threonine-phosphate decarboxylase [Paenibacillus selenitireducens]